jgi:hypothetical protein
MTREHNFRTALRSQLNTYASWGMSEKQDVRRVPVQTFTGFSIELGRTYTLQSDFWGRLLMGRQDFTLRIYLRFDQLKPDVASQLRSDAISLIQLFFNSYFIPPIMQVGETERIEKATIDSIADAALDPHKTRHEIVVRGRYFFTQF